MNSILVQELEEILPDGIYIPEPIKKLYFWIEQNNLFLNQNYSDKKIGILYPEKTLREYWTDNSREGGTLIEFSAYEDSFYAEKVKERLCFFAKSGGDGSMCALWKNANSETKIVHIGSGSGSLLTCTMAENAVDFLRLLAIGYSEICVEEYFLNPPNVRKEESLIYPNVKFQEWVTTEFDVTIPKTGLEIVKNAFHPSRDEFSKWFESVIE